jgi:hypothetical protein
MKSLARRVKRWFRRLAGPPPVRPHLLRRDRPELHLRGPRRDDSSQLVSQLCRYGTLDSATFRGWAAALGEPWRPHRKLWELAFICQALEERQMLRPGRRGLGFAVGAEKLPALFAARGCQITATDLPADDARRGPWAESGQWVGERDALNAAGLCDPAAFRQRVSFRPVDMNHLPTDLAGYDFTWSTCSFEHCGSLQLGLDFLERQMECLAPGGVAVHTTEFNLSSNEATLAVDPGSHRLDRFVDEPPYCDWGSTPPPKVKHLRLNLAGHASTSIALVIRKAG